MNVQFLGCVTKIEPKEKKEKNEEGKLIPTGEFYDKLTLRDVTSGTFVNMSVDSGEVPEVGIFLSVSGTLNINSYNGRTYFSVYNHQFKEKMFVAE